MSKLHKEQQPLLSEDFSDEEIYRQLHSPYQNRSRYKGHAANRAKGTATIIANWPEQWSYLAHVWLILGMCALIIMIIYNVIIAIYILPEAEARENNYNARHVSNEVKSTLPEVFMHVFVENDDKVDYNKYLPSMKIITEKFPNFHYNLYIVLNDTSNAHISRSSAEENNEIALNAILPGKKIFYKPITKLRVVNMEQISLTDYLDFTPLKTQWRQIPPQFIPFLVRAVSVWDRGGIAFDPIILTPNSPDSIYFEKIQNILDKYVERTFVTKEKNKDKALPEATEIKNVKTELKKKLNNIQEILEALSDEDDVSNHSQNNLTEAETHDTNIFVLNRRQLLSYIEPNNETFSTEAIQTPEIKMNDNQKIKGDEKSLQSIFKENIITKKRGLYSFFDYMFHRRFKKNYNETKEDKSVLKTKRETPTGVVDINSKPTEEKYKNLKFSGDLVETYRPMIISTNGKYPEANQLLNLNLSTANDNLDTLTIDLKGNIVATETACHAFIGNVFTSIVHQTPEESLTDFLIAQLSIFCKGLLSTCKGLDIIIL